MKLWKTNSCVRPSCPLFLWTFASEYGIISSWTCRRTNESEISKRNLNFFFSKRWSNPAPDVSEKAELLVAAWNERKAICAGSYGHGGFQVCILIIFLLNEI